MMIYLQLFFEFFKAGLFAIGGGMATLPFLYDISDKTGWFTYGQLADMVAISESTPGPIGVNMATYVGYKKKGVIGAVITTFGVVLPSFVIIILVVSFLRSVDDNKYVQGVLEGIKAAATGLIAFAAYKMGKQTLKNPFQWLTAAAAFVLVAFLGINAVWVILAGILAGEIYSVVNKGGLKE